MFFSDFGVRIQRLVQKPTQAKRLAVQPHRVAVPLAGTSGSRPRPPRGGSRRLRGSRPLEGEGACGAGPDPQDRPSLMTPTRSLRRKSEGLSGRVLRKLPFLAHALYIQVGPPRPRSGPLSAGRASWGSHSGPSGAALSPLSSSRDGLLGQKGCRPGALAWGPQSFG